MTHLQSPSRRAFAGWLATAALAGLTTRSTAGERRGGADPIDRVPRHYTLRRFTSLNRYQVYRVDHAARHGRDVTIGHFSRSESRQILRDAVADWPATRASLLR